VLESFSLDLWESIFLTKKKSSKASRAPEERARAPEGKGRRDTGGEVGRMPLSDRPGVKKGGEAESLVKRSRRRRGKARGKMSPSFSFLFRWVAT